MQNCILANTSFKKREPSALIDSYWFSAEKNASGLNKL